MNTVVRSLFNGRGLRTQLLRGGAGSIFLKIANVGLGLGLAVVLARSLGPRGYGTYVYIYALVSLLAIPAQFGLPTLVVRETAKAEANQQWGLMRGLWQWAGLGATALALFLALMGAILAWIFSERFSALQLTTFAWGLALVPLIALGTLRGAALIGLGKVVQGQLPEQLIRPALLIVLIFGVSVFAGGDTTASEAMALHALAAGFAFVIGAWLLRRCTPSAVAARPKCIYKPRRWFGSALPFALTAGMFLINSQTDVIMLGFFTNPHDVGVYRVAAQGATLVSLGFMAIGIALMPYFTRFHTSGDANNLQRIATAGACVSLLVAFPVLVVFALFGGTILTAVFGNGYGAGHLVLVILAGAEFLNVGFGMVGRLLNMSGHEKDTAKGVAMGAGCNVIMNMILIPLCGMTGAAFATGISLLVWNIALWRMVQYRLRVDSSVLSALRMFRLKAKYSAASN